jgi:hypothetical protein
MIFLQKTPCWITLEQGKTTADAMGDLWRGLEVVKAAKCIGNEMLLYFNIFIIKKDDVW